MQQVNLITQMLAGMDTMSQASGAQVNANGLANTGGLDFMLFLQQQIWSGGLPQLAQEQPDPQFAQALHDAGLSVLLDTEYLAADSNASASGQSLTSPQIPMGGLLQALIDGLKQILDATPVMQTADQQVSASKAAGDGLTKSANITGITASNETSSSFQRQDTGFALTQYPALVALDTWQQTINQLNTSLSNELGSGYKVVSSQPQLQDATQSQQPLPWAMVGSASSTGDGTTVATSSIQYMAGFNMEAQQLADAPEVIKWFVDQGLVGSDNQINTGTIANETMVAKDTSMTNIQSRQTLTGTVQLANGEQAQVSMTLLPQSTSQFNNGAQQTSQYAVRVDIPGDPSSVITATMTVERVDTQLATSWLQTNSQPPAMPALETPILNTVSTDQIQSASAKQNEAVLLSTLQQSAQTEAATLAADIVSTEMVDNLSDSVHTQTDLSATSMTARKPVQAMQTAWRVSNGEVRVLNQQTNQPIEGPANLIQTSQPAVVETQAMENKATAEVSRKQTIPTSTIPVTNTVDVEAELTEVEITQKAQLQEQALKLDGQSESKPFAAEFTALSRMVATEFTEHQSVTLPSTGLLTDGGLQVAVGSNSQALPMSLLQFANSADTPSPYSSLNYLELAQRVQSEASQARNNGNGTYMARLNLNPPDLGQLYVNIAVRGETVALQMAVASTAPKAKLDEGLAQLKQSLEDSGLVVTEIKVVQVGNEGENGSQDGQEQPSHQHQPSKRTAVLKPEVMKTASSHEGRTTQAVPATS